MGESMCFSWLKHIIGCQIVQTNWKTSWNWEHEKLEDHILGAVNERFKKEQYQFKIIKQKNIYKYTECDVLGIKFKKSTHKIFAVEVAFHEGGLNYGKKTREATIEKVISKFIRIALCLRACFIHSQIEVFFATPKVGSTIKEDNNQFYDRLLSAVDILNDVYRNIDEKIHFTLLANKDFTNLIVKPLLIKCDYIADMSELFIRSCKLLNASGTNLDTTLKPDFFEKHEPSAIAWNYMVPILVKMKQKDIDKLINDNTFGFKQWKVLSKKRVPQKRYYLTPISIKGVDYYLTNQWTNQNKQALIQWILDHSK